MIRHILFFVLLVAATGCEFAKTRNYDVQVRNQTDRPLMLWLVKEGPPPEAGWMSPEEIERAQSVRTRGPADNTALGAVLVPPGKLATASSTGFFYKQTRAILRIYFDAKDINDVLASSQWDAKSRVDVELSPGRNPMVVRPDRKVELGISESASGGR